MLPCQDVNFLKSSDMKRRCETELVRMNTTIQLCETAHLIRKNGARISEVIPAQARRPLGGLGGGQKSGLAEKFLFLGGHSMCRDRLDRSGAFERAVCWGIHRYSSR